MAASRGNDFADYLLGYANNYSEDATKSRGLLGQPILVDCISRTTSAQPIA